MAASDAHRADGLNPFKRRNWLYPGMLAAMVKTCLRNGSRKVEMFLAFQRCALSSGMHKKHTRCDENRLHPGVKSVCNEPFDALARAAGP